jgi:hypothetical protein
VTLATSLAMAPRVVIQIGAPMTLSETVPPMLLLRSNEHRLGLRETAPRAVPHHYSADAPGTDDHHLPPEAVGDGFGAVRWISS